jgi:hypothetical protein
MAYTFPALLDHQPTCTMSSLLTTTTSVTSTPQLTSDNDNLRTTMHEIDFEFINAWPASATGGIWTNSFINGLLQLEQLWMPWDVNARTGSKNFHPSSGYHEYAIDWQPTHMRWFVNGGWLDERLDDSYQMPYEKSFVTLSFWTNTDGPWAGNLPQNHPKLYSGFQGVLKRIVCDVPGNAVQLTGGWRAARSRWQAGRLQPGGCLCLREAGTRHRRVPCEVACTGGPAAASLLATHCV